jgi:hypothetical protein
MTAVILLALKRVVCRKPASEPMSIGAAMVSADWVALSSLWVATISPPPRGDGLSDIEASGEMDVATGACSS